MKYPISACRKLRKVVVKSGDLLAEAILGVLPQQYLCTIKQSARRGGRIKGEYSKNYNGLLVGKTDLTFEWCYKRHKWLYKWKNCVHCYILTGYIYHGKSGGHCPLAPGEIDPFRQNKTDPSCQNKNVPCRKVNQQGIFM